MQSAKEAWRNKAFFKYPIDQDIKLKAVLKEDDCLYNLNLSINLKISNKRLKITNAMTTEAPYDGRKDATQVAAQLASPAVLRKRLGHARKRVTPAAADISGFGIAVRDSFMPCDTCAPNKSIQKKHPKRTNYRAEMPLERVYMVSARTGFTDSQVGMGNWCKSTE